MRRALQAARACACIASACAMLSATACGRSDAAKPLPVVEPSTPLVAAKETPKAPTPPASALEVPQADAIAARVAEVAGSVEVSGGVDTTLASGALLHDGSVLHTGDDGSLSLDLENEARITLAPSSTIMLVREEAATVLLLEGAMRVSLGAAAQPQRVPLRVATPDLSFEAERSVDAWVKSMGRDGTQLVVTSGSANVSDSERSSIETRVERRFTYRSDVGNPKVLDSEELGKLLKRMRVHEYLPLTAAVLSKRRSKAEEAFEALRTNIAAQRQLMQSARRDQLKAHHKQDPRSVHVLQALVVEQAQRSVELRKQARASYERRLALAMLASTTAAEKEQAASRLAKDFASSTQ